MAPAARDAVAHVIGEMRLRENQYEGNWMQSRWHVSMLVDRYCGLLLFTGSSAQIAQMTMISL